MGVPPQQTTRPLFSGRQRVVVLFGAVVFVPVAFVTGLYLGGLYDNYKRVKALERENDPSQSETALRKAEQKLLEDRAVLERRIAALEERTASK